MAEIGVAIHMNNQGTHAPIRNLEMKIKREAYKKDGSFELSIGW
jgi:hypothetical protein